MTGRVGFLKASYFIYSFLEIWLSYLVADEVCNHLGHLLSHNKKPAFCHFFSLVIYRIYLRINIRGHLFQSILIQLLF